ncbi:hypothetical protein HpBGD90_14480 [Helicobacter pylori]
MVHQSARKPLFWEAGAYGKKRIIYTEAEEAEASMEETPIENYEVTPPPTIPHKMRNKIVLLKRNKTPKNYLSPVPLTHLTLPPKREGENSEDDYTQKKNNKQTQQDPQQAENDKKSTDI